MALGYAQFMISELYGANPHQAITRRVEVLYNLAKKAKDGVIVELGTYWGYGGIALAFGSQDGDKIQIYTIDDYTEKRGWASEQYGPYDRDVFYRNRRKSGLEEKIIHIQQEALEVAASWGCGPIALLYIDTRLI